MALSTAGIRFKKKYDTAAQFEPSASPQSYLANRYDVKLMYSPVATEANVLLRVVIALYQGLNQYTNLPRFTQIYPSTEMQRKSSANMTISSY